MRTTRYLLSAVAMLAISAAYAADKSIYTGGEAGAYHSLFCPPLPDVLENAQFPGYRCTTSPGALANIAKVLTSPTSIGFTQLDMYASLAKLAPDKAKQLAVIRQLACEGLWMVTKNPRITSYGHVLSLAKRLPVILPPDGSGAAGTFSFLQEMDPEGIGRVTKSNITYAKDTATVIDMVASSRNGAVGFFVQFADPENANIKRIYDKGLTVIPVISREIVRTKVGDTEVFQVQTFQMKSGWFSGKEVTTACTPVVLITGNPDSITDRNDKENQQDLIKEVKSLPESEFLPKEGRVAALLKGAKRLAGKGLEEAVGAVEAARKALQE